MKIGFWRNKWKSRKRRLNFTKWGSNRWKHSWKIKSEWLNQRLGIEVALRADRTRRRWWGRQVCRTYRPCWRRIWKGRARVIGIQRYLWQGRCQPIMTLSQIWAKLELWDPQRLPWVHCRSLKLEYSTVLCQPKMKNRRSRSQFPTSSSTEKSSIWTELLKSKKPISSSSRRRSHYQEYLVKDPAAAKNFAPSSKKKSKNWCNSATIGAPKLKSSSLNINNRSSSWRINKWICISQHTSK